MAASVDQIISKARKLARSGDVAGAKSLYASVLERFPRNARALEGMRALQEARPVQQRPGGPPREAMQSLSALYEQGRLTEVVSQATQLAMEFPKVSILRNMIGAAQAGLGETEKALASYQAALEIDPNHPAVLNNLGTLLMKLGQPRAAVPQFERALKAKPGYPQAMNNLGVALKELGQNSEASDILRQLVAQLPGNPEAWNHLGLAQRALGQVEDAIDSLTRAVQLRPGYAKGHNNLGNVLKDKGQMDAAIASYRGAIAADASYADAHNNLGTALSYQGLTALALPHFDTAIRLRPDFAEALSNRCLALNYLPETTGDELLSAHQEFDARLARASEPSALADAGARMRIGYVSADFREHSVSYFFAPLLDAHDPKRVEVFCYANATAEDETTMRLKARTTHWRNIAGRNDRDVLDQIIEDKIDVLVDLGGHTANNRLSVFAMKPAPLQVTWLGYPATTGLSAMDYRITDLQADPEGESESFHSETLMRLPSGFLCYAGDPTVPPADHAPCAQQGHVTFGSFNNLAKMSDRVIALWADILNAIPNSRLLLKARALAEPSTQDRLTKAFEAHEVGTDRLTLMAQVADKTDHLRLYDKIDIALDTFPYNGTTTTCEALWMGVPVVTLTGTLHAGRVGTSLLHQVGLDEFAVPDTASYAALAAHLASNPEGLTALRRGLRDRMLRSPLCDAKGFAREIEAAFAKMIARRRGKAGS